MVVVLLLGGVRVLHSLRAPFVVSKKIVKIAKNHGIIMNTEENSSSSRWRHMCAMPSLLLGFPPQYALGSYTIIYSLNISPNHPLTLSITHSLIYSLTHLLIYSFISTLKLMAAMRL